MKTDKTNLISIIKDNKYTGYIITVFYFVINILLLTGIILSFAGKKLFNDVDTTLYWISEIMLTVRQIIFIALPCIIISLYIEKGE